MFRWFATAGALAMLALPGAAGAQELPLSTGDGVDWSQAEERSTESVQVTGQAPTAPPIVTATQEQPFTPEDVHRLAAASRPQMLAAPGETVTGAPGRSVYFGQVYGQKTVNGQYKLIGCNVEIFSGAPAPTRRINYGVAVACSDPAISGAAASNLVEINPRLLVPLVLGSRFSVYGDNALRYVVEPYTRYREDQLQNIYAWVDLHIAGAVRGQDGWVTQVNGTPSGTECSSIGGSQMRCEIRTYPFAFLPRESYDCGSGDVCDTVKTSLAQAQQNVQYAQNLFDQYHDYVMANYASEPEVPLAEPETGVEEVDAESGEPAGEWAALPRDIGRLVDSGALTLEQGIQRAEAQAPVAASAAAPVVNCSAKISRKIGGVRTIHTEGPELKARRVLWWVRKACRGLPAFAFRGNPDLVLNKPLGYLVKYGNAYNDAVGVGPDGRARLTVRSEHLEIGNRRGKRVKWHSTVELPDAYTWAHDKPFGNLSGINEDLTKCHRESTQYPAYLNVLKCVIYSTAFK